MLMPVHLSPSVRRLRLVMSALLLTGLMAVALLSGAAPAGAKAKAKASHVPQGFVGVDIDGPLFDPGTPLNLGNQMSNMVTNGAQSVRMAFDWSAAQPYASWSDVPADKHSDFVTGPGGRPISFKATDAVVGNAARRGLSVLPTIIYAPTWDAKSNPSGGLATPQNVTPYAQYAAALVQRYGAQGSFWKANPQIHKTPVRMWQIWNEPNIAFYWPQPFGKGYVALLRAAHDAIKHVDPRAKVVLASLTNYAWKSIDQVYAVPGAKKLFDLVAVNGFTRNPANDILYLRLMRHALDHFGDSRKPMLDTEFSWPSGRGQAPQHYDFSTTRKGQATDISSFMTMAANQRTKLGLAGIYYYNWIGKESKGAPIFNFAGLLSLNVKHHVQVKPALGTFRKTALSLEGCRAKGSTATQCRR
jgi:hypothetical protein